MYLCIYDSRVRVLYLYDTLAHAYTLTPARTRMPQTEKPKPYDPKS